MSAIYNELDTYAAQWIRNLAAANHISPGAVDDRSIKELVASDVAAATQAHFFAGVGVWSYALRLAGWPDDAPVWTGSCPCQPFSVAGKQRGTDDERHLWPEWRRLIAECLPPALFGEQVASRDGREWLAAVRADLEALGYAVGSADLCAAGVGAPHIRQRLYFGAVRLGHANGIGARRNGGAGAGAEAQSSSERLESWGLGDGSGASGATGGLADSDSAGWRVIGRGWLLDGERQALGHDVDGRGEIRGLGDADDARPQGHGRPLGLDGATRREAEERHSAAPGAWSEVEWLRCLDGKARPIESGLEPLVDGAPARVGRLRAYGNAISPQVAAAFIRSFMAACEVLQ